MTQVASSAKIRTFCVRMKRLACHISAEIFIYSGNLWVCSNVSDLHLKSYSHWLCTSEHTQGISSEFCFFGQQDWAQLQSERYFPGVGIFSAHQWLAITKESLRKSLESWANEKQRSILQLQWYLQMKLQAINFSSQSKFNQQILVSTIAYFEV